MKSDVKEKWLEGLESGRYRQARFNLKTKSGMCCLGVLCDVMGQTWGTAKFSMGPDDTIEIADDDSVEYMKGLENYNGEYITLPTELAEQFSLTNEQIMDLQRLNDGSKSFEPTIKYIKEKL